MYNVHVQRGVLTGGNIQFAKCRELETVLKSRDRMCVCVCVARMQGVLGDDGRFNCIRIAERFSRR